MEKAKFFLLKKVILILTGGIISLFLVAWLFFRFLFGPPQYEKFRVPSPEGNYVAHSEVLKGPAFARDVLKVFVQKRGRPHIFPWRRTVLHCFHARLVDISWKSEESLLISTNCKPLDVVTEEKKFGEVIIDYAVVAKPSIPDQGPPK